MSIRKLVIALSLTALSLPAVAQDVAGKWNASMEGFEGALALFDFTVEGDVLKGNITADTTGTTPITDGKIEGNKISFKSSVDGGPAGPMTIGYAGVLEGDKITLTLDLGDAVAAAGAPPFEMPPLMLTRAPE